MESQLIKLTGLSSSEQIRITKDLTNGDVSITFIDDKSHGYRTFVLTESDWIKFKTIAAQP